MQIRKILEREKKKELQKIPNMSHSSSKLDGSTLSFEKA